jgi:hypothetical protein
MGNARELFLGCTLHYIMLIFVKKEARERG